MSTFKSNTILVNISRTWEKVLNKVSQAEETLKLLYQDLTRKPS